MRWISSLPQLDVPLDSDRLMEIPENRPLLSLFVEVEIE